MHPALCDFELLLGACVGQERKGFVDSFHECYLSACSSAEVFLCRVDCSGTPLVSEVFADVGAIIQSSVLRCSFALIVMWCWRTPASSDAWRCVSSLKKLAQNPQLLWCRFDQLGAAMMSLPSVQSFL